MLWVYHQWWLPVSQDECIWIMGDWYFTPFQKESCSPTGNTGKYMVLSNDLLCPLFTKCHPQVYGHLFHWPCGGCSRDRVIHYLSWPLVLQWVLQWERCLKDLLVHPRRHLKKKKKKKNQISVTKCSNSGIGLFAEVCYQIHLYPHCPCHPCNAPSIVSFLRPELQKPYTLEPVVSTLTMLHVTLIQPHSFNKQLQLTSLWRHDSKQLDCKSSLGQNLLQTSSEFLLL